jgi:glycosyltransferase involved in cell wall biosynthesis
MDICFLLIGDGENIERCKYLVKDLPTENIKFLGRQNDAESIINIFDIGVLTTNIRIHREGISNSIIEYMAMGKPVIATQGGGTLLSSLLNRSFHMLRNGSIKSAIFFIFTGFK